MEFVIFPARPGLIDGQFTGRKDDVFEVVSESQIDIPGAEFEKIVVGSLTRFHYILDRKAVSAILEIDRYSLERRLFRGVIDAQKRTTIPSIMAVINATPDSFYAGSRVNANHRLVDTILDLKPDIIDIGGESTRPGSMAIDPDTEQKRLKPVIDYVSQVSDIPISLDSRNWRTVQEFLEQISYINDISGFTDEKMIHLASQAD
ncbi:MAG: dihydropteroate synthase, partial [Thermoplasmataceae archaeon]